MKVKLFFIFALLLSCFNANAATDYKKLYPVAAIDTVDHISDIGKMVKISRLEKSKAHYMKIIKRLHIDPGDLLYLIEYNNKHYSLDSSEINKPKWKNGYVIGIRRK